MERRLCHLPANLSCAVRGCGAWLLDGLGWLLHFINRLLACLFLADQLHFLFVVDGCLQWLRVWFLLERWRLLFFLFVLWQRVHTMYTIYLHGGFVECVLHCRRWKCQVMWRADDVGHWLSHVYTGRMSNGLGWLLHFQFQWSEQLGCLFLADQLHFLFVVDGCLQ